MDFAEGIVVKHRLRDKYGKSNIILRDLWFGEEHRRGIACKKLSMNFIDMDEEIVKSRNEHPEIFRLKGEEGFVDGNGCSYSFMRVAKSVIACGGGAVTVPATADALKNAGSSYFWRRPQKKYSSTQGAVGERPLLKADDPKRPYAIFMQRVSTYRGVCISLYHPTALPRGMRRDCGFDLTVL